MSLAGVRSNRGDGYQTAVAIRWAVMMLFDKTIAAIEVDTTALVGNTPATVDDIVVRYVDGHSIYLQCKKNEPNFDAWTIKTLSDELLKTATLLRGDQAGRVMFCSRNNFGQIGKLREHLQTQPNYEAYIKSLSKPLKQEHDSLISFFGGPKACSIETFSLLKRVEFLTTSSIELLEEYDKAMLARHVTNQDVAYSALWKAVDQLGARVVRANSDVHSLTREELFMILEQHDCKLRSIPALQGNGVGNEVDGIAIPDSIRRAFTGSGDATLENWQKRYESLVARLQAEDPSSLLADAGQLLKSGAYDEAQHRIDEAIAKSQKHASTLATAYVSKAELQLLRFEYTAALESMKMACYWAPDNPDLVTQYSSLLIKLEHYRDAVMLLRTKLSEPADNLEKAHWHCNLGLALYALADYEGAQKEFNSAEQRFASTDVADSQSRSDLIHGLFASRGLLFEHRGQIHEAEKCYEAAAAYFRQELANPAGSLHARLGLANVLNNLALLHWTSGKGVDAVPFFEEAKSVLSDVDDWGARHNLALIALNFGEYLTEGGQFELAEPLILQSLEIRRKAMQENRWHPAAAAALCENLLGLSTLYFRSGRPVESLNALEEARAQVEVLRHEDPTIYSRTVSKYSTNATAIYRANWKLNDALDAADEAIRVLRKLEPTDDALEDLATSLNNKANVLLEMKRYNEAGTTHQEALKIRAHLAQSGNNRILGDLAISLSAFASLIPDNQKAMQLFGEAERILNGLVEKQPMQYRRQLAMLLDNMTIHFTSMECGEKAVEYGRKAVRLFRTINMDSDNAHRRELASALCNLALAHENRKDNGGAIDCLEEARQIFTKLRTENDPRVLLNLATVFESLHHAYTMMDDSSAADMAIQNAILTIEHVPNDTDAALNTHVEQTRERLHALAAKAAPSAPDKC